MTRIGLFRSDSVAYDSLGIGIGEASSTLVFFVLGRLGLRPLGGDDSIVVGLEGRNDSMRAVL